MYRIIFTVRDIEFVSEHIHCYKQAVEFWTNWVTHGDDITFAIMEVQGSAGYRHTIKEFHNDN